MYAPRLRSYSSTPVSFAQRMLALLLIFILLWTSLNVSMNAAVLTAPPSSLVAPPLEVHPASLAAQPSTAHSTPQKAPVTSTDFGKLQLSFVPTRGQTNATASFTARAMGGTILFTPGGLRLTLPQSRSLSPAGKNQHDKDLQHAPTLAPKEVQMRFEGANASPTISATNKLPGVANYFIGNDSSRWRTNVPTYAGIMYQQLYDGIDLHYEGVDSNLKGTYTVASGADPTRIHWRYEGASHVQVDAATGDLTIQIPTRSVGADDRNSTADNMTLIEHAPIAWQSIQGQRVSVNAKYALDDNGSVRFALGDYDHNQPLIIDPTLTYSILLGGSGYDEARDIAVESDGTAYITGETVSNDFYGAGTDPYPDDSDAFVVKLNPDGSIAYSTYLGGSSPDYGGNAIAVDTDHNVYIAGHTFSDDLPSHGSSVYNNGIDAFVTKLSGSGGVLYSFYIGGKGFDIATSIAVDQTQGVYITGSTASDDLIPSGTWGYNTTYGGSENDDAFVVKLNPSGTGLSYGNYLGGDGDDKGYGIAIDGNNKAYVTGVTHSSTMLGVNTGAANEQAQIFVVCMGSSGTTPEYIQFFGGPGDDIGYGIAVTSDGDAYITGQINAPFLTIPSALPLAPNGREDAFVLKLNKNDGSVAFRTYLSGDHTDEGDGIALDTNGNIYVTGFTHSNPFLDPNPSPPFGGGNASDAFVAKLNPTGSTVLYSRYLGGDDTDQGKAVAADSAGNAYVVGYTYSSNFDAPNSQIPQSVSDGFVSKISSPIEVTVTDAAGNPVRALNTNTDGWPALNADVPSSPAEALTVKVTVQNTTNSTLSIANLPVTFGSSSNPTRFFVFSAPSVGISAGQCVASQYEQFSYTQYGTTCRASLPVGGVQTFTWGVWVQPSAQGLLTISAEIPSMTPSPEGHASVTIPQAAIHPVVFLHGILGSMPPQNFLITNEDQMHSTLDPFLGSYWPLMDTLQKMGYEYNKTLFPWTYNWRQSNIISGNLLGSLLTGVVLNTSNANHVSYGVYDKADLVVHSMGGLVARSYIEGSNYPSSGTVRKIVFVASPHKGFPFDYQTWENMTWSAYLDNSPGFSSVGMMTSLMDNILWPTLVFKQYHPTHDELAAQCQPIVGDGVPLNLYVFPGPLPEGGSWACSKNVVTGWAHDPSRGILSLQQMLPTVKSGDTNPPYASPAYLVNTSNSPWPYHAPGFPSDPGYEANTFLNDLNANINKLASRVGLPNIYVLYGDGAPETDLQYTVNPPPGNNLWRHGQVANTLRDTTNGNGDDLISWSSTTLRRNGLLATLPVNNERSLDARQGIAQRAEHKEIMYHPDTQQQWLPSFLGAIAQGNALPFSTEYHSPFAGGNVQRLFAIKDNCPINLMVTDPQGRRLGYDPSTGQIVREIPNAVYTSPGVEPQLILIADAVPGTYQVKATGYGSGSYTIETDNIDSSGSTPINIVAGQTTSGQVATFTTTYNPQASGATATSTPNGTATRTGTSTRTLTPSKTPTTGTNTRTPTPSKTPTATATTIAPTNTATSLGATVTPTTGSGTLVKKITFEGGSLTDATTGADSVSGSTTTINSSTPLKGAFSATVPNTTSSYVRENLTAANTLYVSFYLRVDALPSSSAQIMGAYNGSTRLGNLQLTSSGALRLRNDTTTVGSDSPPLTVGTLYRVGLRQTKGSSSGVLEAFVAQGDNTFGTPFASSSSQSISSGIDNVRVGAVQTTAVSITVDDITLDTGSMPNPSGGTNATATSTALVATPTNTATATNTSPAAPSNTPTTATSTRTLTPSKTSTTPASTPTLTSSRTPTVPTSTPTFTPSRTPTVPTSTPSKTPSATATVAGSTNTATNTATRTATASVTATPTTGGSTLVKAITFEGGSLTDANTGADSVTGSGIVLDSSTPLKGAYSARISNASNAYVRESLTATNTLYVSFYLRVDALPSSSVQIMGMYNSSTRMGALQLTSSGTLRLRNDSTTIGSDSAPLTVGTVYRVGLRQTKGSGTGILEAFVAQGDNAFGTSFASSSSEGISSAIDSVCVGAVTSVVVGMTVDTITLDTGSMPGPSGAGGQVANYTIFRLRSRLEDDVTLRSLLTRLDGRVNQ